MQYRYRHRNPKAIWSEWGDHKAALSSYSDWEEEGRPLYASPQPANPAQVTDAKVVAAINAANEVLKTVKPIAIEGEHLEFPPTDTKRIFRAALIAAIGADSTKPSLLDRERAAMDVTQRRAIEGERISDAVLAWMVKYDLLDAGSEYHVSDVLAVLNDLAPSDHSAAIGAGGQAVASLDDVAARLWKADAEDSGTPASVADGRTREAFDDQAEELKARWRKFAKAASSALSQPHPADERVVETLRETADALETLLSADPDMPTYQSDYDAADQQLERARAVLSAKEGR